MNPSISKSIIDEKEVDTTDEADGFGLFGEFAAENEAVWLWALLHWLFGLGVCQKKKTASPTKNKTHENEHENTVASEALPQQRLIDEATGSTRWRAYSPRIFPLTSVY